MKKAEHYRQDTPEQINMCMSCPFPECVDCIARGNEHDTKSLDRFQIWNGKAYTIAQLSRISGRSQSAVAARIKSHGIDFAMSDHRFYRDYLKSLPN